MGFFDKILGSQRSEYPPLDPGSPAAKDVEQVMGELASLAKEVRDPLEVVPGSDKTFVFIGKPPKEFGIFWIKDGQVENIRKLANEKQIPNEKFQLVSEELREAYKNNVPAEKYSITIADRKITVLPSDSLNKTVGNIVDKLQA
jgi:hypothetical protein